RERERREVTEERERERGKLKYRNREEKERWMVLYTRLTILFISFFSFRNIKLFFLHLSKCTKMQIWI
ncbi:unnamed protein product, partial [Brassica rapa subsp. trilocularis]